MAKQAPAPWRLIATVEVITAIVGWVWYGIAASETNPLGLPSIPMLIPVAMSALAIPPIFLALTMAGKVPKGIVTPAKINRVGKIAINGRSDISVDYVFEGDPYSASLMVPEEMTKKIQIGDSIDVLVDPERPNICRVD